MYKRVAYRVRNLEELRKEIFHAGRLFPDTRRIFLADGDAMNLEYSALCEILLELNAVFPYLARVNLYASGTSILAKSAEELQGLKTLKLNTLYLGLESGGNAILKLVRKQENSDDMARAVILAQDCGLRCSVMVLLGLGGRTMSSPHIEKTVEILNRMQPRLLSFLRFVEFPETKMFAGYEALTEYEVVGELYKLIAGLELKRTVIRANHSSNPIPLEGRLPHDKKVLLNEIKAILDSGRLDKNSPGPIPLWL
jgi:radical SAM superfamily enzyme YgiQ (UPF0313 family)